jgi:hypothetical protein
MFRSRMTRCTADDAREYGEGIAEIQSLLAGTDPAAAQLTRAESARLSVLGAEVTAAPAPAGHGRTWWPARQYRQHRQVLLASIAVPALLAGTAAGWAIAASPAASQLTNAVVCYSLPHPPEKGISENAAGGTDSGVAPVAFCARQWAAGDVVPGVHRAPPRLAACAMPRLGDVGVFPDITCVALHLPPVPAGFVPATRTFTALQNALIDAMVGSSHPRCVSEPAAVSDTRRIAAAYGSGRRWRIAQPKVVQPGSCWEAQADPVTHVINIFPQPGVYPPGNDPGRIVEQAMAPLYSQLRCRPGSKPESAAAIRRELLGRLLAAGFKGWKVMVVGEPASKLTPCYVLGGLQLNRTVDINSLGTS